MTDLLKPINPSSPLHLDTQACLVEMQNIHSSPLSNIRVYSAQPCEATPVLDLVEWQDCSSGPPVMVRRNPVQPGGFFEFYVRAIGHPSGEGFLYFMCDHEPAASISF